MRKYLHVNRKNKSTAVVTGLAVFLLAPFGVVGSAILAVTATLMVAASEQVIEEEIEVNVSEGLPVKAETVSLYTLPAVIVFGTAVYASGVLLPAVFLLLLYSIIVSYYKYVKKQIVYPVVFDIDATTVAVINP